ncbi:MAG TPA: thioesterase family protein [Solirubrobacteraceae bacterium]|nr:thioesterase family protein [Solirubrobacteraceae bacterium]
MSESIFLAERERFVPTEQARGPWDPNALHGGAPAALIASAFEQMEPGAGLRVGRLSFEFLRPIPMAPLTLQTRIVRPGRRVQELAAELSAGEETIVRAGALRVQGVPGEAVAAVAEIEADGLVREDEQPDAAMPPLDAGKPMEFSLNDARAGEASFAGTAMEMRWLNDPWRLGPGRVWQRLRHPLLPGRPPSPLARLAATADFCNGVSATLRFDRFLFINADLSIHLHRIPAGEWIGLDARTRLHEGGAGIAEGVLHDERGLVGRAFQTLVVQPR